MICTNCGSTAAPTAGPCPGCGRPTPDPAAGMFPDPLAAPPTTALGGSLTDPRYPATRAMPTSPYGVPVDPYTGPTTGDPFAATPPAAYSGPTSGAPGYAPPAYSPPATPPATPPYAPPGQPTGYAPPGQPAAYGQPAGLGQPVAYGQPAGLGQPVAYGQPAGPGQPVAYGQPAGPGQPAAYGPPGQPQYGPPYAAYPGPGPAPSQVYTIVSYVFGGLAVVLGAPFTAIIGLALAGFGKKRHEPHGELAIKIVSGCLVLSGVIWLLHRN
ncbi:Collagen alpha-5(VI) chain [Actinoplanes sp. SE50]|uniref:hypothetical protein n=1 Tax=unclassified Actinoplanes TaxID=2626549 RepID=UPI00023EBEC7|nr:MULTISPECIES: hypothetical protein [unclassified Actinoplanes]AEV82949.1 Collagen alpha-5(VI) chain [Actinoplanes sp. SE50/110]ATO81345.1 Collagen alpha-5(VI) chain [Actinoplanes sp. SE50]SLL98752.1 hypothetical protein ACSP50_1979 [Actinoplanes sp. SE50/110]